MYSEYRLLSATRGRSQQESQLRQIPRHGRKLILHFDARNTIFVADLFSRITVEMALNTYISGVVWGVEESDGRWRCVSESVSPHPPSSGVTSLYKLFERSIVRVPADRQRLRETLGNFTEQPVGRRFRPVFEENLQRLRWPFAEVDDRLTVTGREGSAYHYLLPSFLNLVVALEDSGRDFCVVIRTFGRDAPHILHALRLLRDGQHPGFPRRSKYQVNLSVERFNRLSTSEFRYTRSDGSELRRDRDVYEHWNACSGVLGVVDDFDFWQANDYHHSAAKPIWYDLGDKRHLHAIFDDNIRVYDEDNIVDVKEFQGDSVTSCAPEKLERLEDAIYVTANLIQSINNPNYFIDKVLQCEANFDRLASG